MTSSRYSWTVQPARIRVSFLMDFQEALTMAELFSWIKLRLKEKKLKKALKKSLNLRSSWMRKSYHSMRLLLRQMMLRSYKELKIFHQKSKMELILMMLVWHEDSRTIELEIQKRILWKSSSHQPLVTQMFWWLTPWGQKKSNWLEWEKSLSKR